MNSIEEIAKQIKQAGGTLYLVGGAVRDKILGKTQADQDYCVVGITPNTFKGLFPDAITRGKSFPVYDLDGKEFAMARKESKTGYGHKRFAITTGKEITIKEDLARRDITINAMAQDVLTQEIIDPFSGKEDLKNKIIRATTNRFVEDPLRVYRVARFSATFDFKVEQKTIQLMHSLKSELCTLSKERVFEEFRKALLSKKPSLFFDVLRKAKVLDIHFKEIADLIGSEQPLLYHPEGDAYTHTVLALDKSVQLTEQDYIRYSVLVHDLGKGITPKEMYPHHYGHDKNGIPLVETLSKRIGVPSIWLKAGKMAAQEHMKAGMYEKLRPGKKVAMLEKLEKSTLDWNGMKIVVICDKGKSADFDVIGKEMTTKINGKYIKEKYKIEEGKKLKEKLTEERIKWIKHIE